MTSLRTHVHSAPDPLDTIEECYRRGWTDGLPVVPPTPDRVSAMLDYVGLDRRRVLGEVPVRRRTLTAEQAAANAVMLGGGYFNPLSGYMDLADVIGVAERMQMSSRLFWPTPVVNMLRGNSLSEEIKSAGKIALRDPNVEGNPVIAVQAVDKIEIVTEKQIGEIVKHVYGTTDHEHPGVVAFTEAGDTLISGPIEVLNFSSPFESISRTLVPESSR